MAEVQRFLLKNIVGDGEKFPGAGPGMTELVLLFISGSYVVDEEAKNAELKR